MKIISSEEVNRIAVEDLRLDPDALDLSSAEGIAGLIRKTAGFLCPCSSTDLVNRIEQLLCDLVGQAVLEEAQYVLEAMISYGDLLELTVSDDEGRRRLLFGAPPSYVRIENGPVLLVGVVPEHFSPLPDELEKKLVCVNHVRRLDNPSDQEIEMLSDLGLLELPERYWQRSPVNVGPEKLMKQIELALDSRQETVEDSDVMIISRSKEFNRKYYRHRWKQLERESGIFVSRRPAKYSNDSWRIIRVEDGVIKRILPLPLDDSGRRACDDAWYIQAAMDFLDSSPQAYDLREGVDGEIILDLFSPIPMWARRRWDALGRPIPSNKSLMSYCFKVEQIQSEIAFCENTLWLKSHKPDSVAREPE